MKATPTELKLHQDKQEKKDIAFSELYITYAPKLFMLLAGDFPLIAKDRDNIDSVINDVFISYYLKPESYNPELSPLFHFLKIAARRDLINLVKKESKRKPIRNSLDDVELLEQFRNRVIQWNSSTDATIITNETMTAVQNILESFFPNEKDIILARMVLADVRKTEHYSKELEIENLTIPEQRAEVKKHKDRIKQVLKRNDVENRIKSLLQ